MLRDVVDVKPTDKFRLWLRFDDGVEGEVDVESLVAFTGVFERLKDPAVFADVRVNRDIGTIVWSTGADIDPGVLYENLHASQTRKN
jgi:hypothetical protein